MWLRLALRAVAGRSRPPAVCPDCGAAVERREALYLTPESGRVGWQYWPCGHVEGL